MMRACTFIGYTPCTSLPLCRKHKHSSCGSLAHFLYTFFIPARTAADSLFRFAHLPEGKGRNHPLVTTKLHKGLTPVAAHFASQIPFPGFTSSMSFAKAIFAPTQLNRGIGHAYSASMKTTFASSSGQLPWGKGCFLSGFFKATGKNRRRSLSK